MRFLLLGLSRIARKRVLPALGKLETVEAVDIASRRPVDAAAFSWFRRGDVYEDYQSALTKSKAEVVYISLVNSLHEQWVEIALSMGKHVIVDKPAFLDSATAERMVAMARRKNLCLGEAIVFGDHPQMSVIQNFFSQVGGPPTRVVSSFSFPPFEPSDFRNFVEYGGGSLYDLGPYAAATSRLFFNESPKEIHCRITGWNPATGVDTGFVLMAVYSGGRSLLSHYGFDTEYINRITLVGPRFVINLNRAYTLTPDIENEIEIRSLDRTSAVKVERADSFERFLLRFVDHVSRGDGRDLSEALIEDARMLDRIRKYVFA